jgi:hypothetical protein
MIVHTSNTHTHTQDETVHYKYIVACTKFGLMKDDLTELVRITSVSQYYPAEKVRDFLMAESQLEDPRLVLKYVLIRTYNYVHVNLVMLCSWTPVGICAELSASTYTWLIMMYV